MKKSKIWLIGSFLLVLVLVMADFFSGRILERAGVLSASEYMSFYELYTAKTQANSGDLQAMKGLQAYYGIWKNDKTNQVYWLRKAAESGDLASQHNLGVILYRSDETKPEGISWLSKAANNGYRQSITFLELHSP